MWEINDFNRWIDDGRPINENVINLNISNSNIEILKNLENLVNLKYLTCCNNKLTSLEGIENLVNLEKLNCNDNMLSSLKGIENLINLKYLHCYNNQLTSLEGIENFIKLIKNNKMQNKINYNFTDSNDYIELNNLFNNLIDNLIKCENNDKIDEYIEEIEQMIIELNGFQNYVLK
jgi:Leucine-rich repeat (LRR) protein